MQYVHFECVNAAGNAFRFYRYEISEGFFDSFYLKAIAGRIGTTGVVRHLASGDSPELWKRVAKETMERFAHGYDLIECQCPAEVEREIRKQKATADARSYPAISPRKILALRRSRMLLAGDPNSTSDLRRVDAMLDEIDPNRRRAIRHTNKRQQDSGASAAPTVEGTREVPAQRASGQILRDIIGSLARDLLQDDPLAVDSILRGLSLPFPDEVDGTNVAFLRARNDRVLSMGINQFVHEAHVRSEPKLTAACAEKLRSAGIETVGELIKREWNSLLGEIRLSRPEVDALIRACARYKLFFSMEQIRYTDAS